MKRTCLLLMVLAAVSCSFERPLVYAEPPAGSYTAATFQLKDDPPAAVAGATVTAEFFPATKVHPLLGRYFMDGDAAAGAARVVVLSRPLWQRRFGGSPAIIGRTIDIDGRPAVIVGIAPPGFEVPTGAELWVMKPLHDSP